MQNKRPKLGINIYFAQYLLSVATFYPNIVYLQLPHSKEGSKKFGRSHKLQTNREN